MALSAIRLGMPRDDLYALVKARKKDKFTMAYWMFSKKKHLCQLTKEEVDIINAEETKKGLARSNLIEYMSKEERAALVDAKGNSKIASSIVKPAVKVESVELNSALSSQIEEPKKLMSPTSPQVQVQKEATKSPAPRKVLREKPTPKAEEDTKSALPGMRFTEGSVGSKSVPRKPQGVFESAGLSSL